MIYLIDLSPQPDDPQIIREASQRLKQRIEKDYGERIVYDKSRPSLQTFDLNISHHYPIVMAIVDRQRVGVDVTFRDGGPTFSEPECKQLFTGKPPVSQQEFLLMWAIREAHLKYTGEGFRETPVSIESLPDIPTLCELESRPFSPVQAQVDNQPVYCFLVRGLIAAARCSTEAFSQVEVLN